MKMIMFFCIDCTYDKGRDIFNGHMFEWTYPYVLKSIFQLPDPRGLPFVVNFGKNLK